ncbi:MAG: ABC transporter ATP-binding protein [Candidatus Competibacterales bacterium]|nr:ABC transporter ATP-binding protein [Candidatus Competibacterales bacterium]
MNAAAIDARRVSMVFGHGPERVVALDEVSVTIRQNEFFTLLGPSGCGKTTLLRLIAGFEQPTAGELRLEDRPLTGLPPYRRPVNTVFQNYALFPHMSVARNVAFGLEMQGVAPAARESRVREMLALVRLADHGNRRPAQLSGGQQQRVALARALANQPRVLLLDEPLSALDLKLRKEMQLELKRLQLETGITFVFVTHDQEEALTMSDRIAVMQDGRILQVGAPAEIYEHPVRRFVADFIGESNFLEADCIAPGRFRLDSGAELDAAADGRPGERTTLAVRPERVELRAAGQGLDGTVETVIYFGTDTTYHVRLDQGDRFQARVQNRTGATARFRSGDPVGLVIPPEAVQVLVD